MTLVALKNRVVSPLKLFSPPLFSAGEKLCVL